MRSLYLNPLFSFYILPFFGGLLYSLGFPIKGFPHSMLFSFMGIFLLFISLDLPYSPFSKRPYNPLPKRKLFKKILTALSFCLGHCLSGYYWIPFTLKEFGHIPTLLSFMITPLFSLIIMPQLMVFIIILHYWEKLTLKKLAFLRNSSLQSIFFAALFTTLELITPQQFPAHLGHTWLQLSPYLGLAPYGGVGPYSFFSYWLILSLISAYSLKKWDFLALISFLLFLSANIMIPLHWSPSKEAPPLRIRLVQGNIGNFMKTSSESGHSKSLKEIYDTYIRLSTAPAQAPRDLIIWPETAFPSLLNSAMMRVNNSAVPFIVRESSTQAHAQLFFGGYDRANKENSSFYETEYNSGFLISRQGEFEEVYHKRKLIPFGETLPFGPLNIYLAKVINNISYFAKGNKSTLFHLDSGHSFISAICYEILFSGFIKSYLNDVTQKNESGPHFIVNLTNDSWYGNTSEPYQHQYLSHWRALEYQLPILRMTNTGITSVLYPDGKESKRLPLFKEGHLDIDLYTQKFSPTPWQNYGNITLALIFFMTFFLGFFIQKKTSSKDPL